MKKKANKKGFTIMEMLIVVAIIAVLVAIAIPTFSSALTKAKEAADVANVRAAYAEIMVKNLSDGDPFPANKSEFLAKVDGGKLNTNDNLTYTENPESSGKYDIKYTATKLKNEKTGTNIFIWTLKSN